LALFFKRAVEDREVWRHRERMSKSCCTAEDYWWWWCNFITNYWL